MNLLMLYWEPGVDDIQASPNFFSLSLEDTDQLTERWPQLEGHSTSALEVPHYLHDGGLDTSGKSVVVDWYYKKRNAEGRRVLHYCKFCNGVVLYASENDPAWPKEASTTTASIPSCSMRCSWRRTARRDSGTST